jgi:hypothetical protein
MVRYLAELRPDSNFKLELMRLEAGWNNPLEAQAFTLQHLPDEVDQAWIVIQLLGARGRRNDRVSQITHRVSVPWLGPAVHGKSRGGES